MKYNALIIGPIDCVYYSDNGFDGWNQEEVERDEFIGRMATVERASKEQYIVWEIENFGFDDEFMGFYAKRKSLRFIED